jgi:hypothetical protein
MSATSHTKSGGICGYVYLLWVHAGNVDGDVDLVGAEVDETAAPGEWSVAEAASVVADEVQRAKSLDKARDHTLAGGSNDGSHPDDNSSQRRCWPYGGRQLSWWCHGSSHG